MPSQTSLRQFNNELGAAPEHGTRQPIDCVTGDSIDHETECGGNEVVLHLFEFEVTDEPIDDPMMRKLFRSDRDRIERAGEKVIGGATDQVAILEKLVAEFPNLPKVYNYLTIAYANAGEYDKVDHWTKETYRRFPDYLFGMTNYVHTLLAERRIDEVTQILDRRFSLHLWLRNRRRYHVSEIVAFNGLMVRYFAMLGQKDIARNYLQMLFDIAPDHPGTAQAATFVDRGIIRSLVRRLIGSR